jgi:hypothetical protein
VPSGLKGCKKRAFEENKQSPQSFGFQRCIGLIRFSGRVCTLHCEANSCEKIAIAAEADLPGARKEDAIRLADLKEVAKLFTLLMEKGYG